MDARLQDEDAVSLRTAKAELPLYITRIKVYPRAIKGLWRRVKWAVLVVLLGLYYAVPWLRWDRGPDAPNQAILIDLDGRRGWFFDVVIWPQEIYFVTGLLILGAFALMILGKAPVRRRRRSPCTAHRPTAGALDSRVSPGGAGTHRCLPAGGGSREGRGVG